MQETRQAAGTPTGRNNAQFSSRKLLESMKIRSFDLQKDLQKAEELNRLSVQNSAIGRLWQEDWNISVRYVPEAYLENRGDFLMVFEGEKLLAMGGVQKLDEKKAIIKKIRVHPDARGRGLAKMLVELLENRARELGYTEIRADVNVENLPMQKLLPEQGYILVREIPEFGMTMKVYEKRL